jgi:2-oxoisovalerate dehydrogenase E1 component
VLDTLLRRVTEQPAVANGLLAGRFVLRFHYTEPSGQVTVDLRGPDLTWELGESRLAADLELFQAAEVAHRFWLGALNVPLAIASRKVVARGDVTKALALLPAVKPVYPLYRQVLRDLGMSEAPPGAPPRAGSTLERWRNRARAVPKAAWSRARALLRGRRMRELDRGAWGSLPVSLVDAPDDGAPRFRDPFLPTETHTLKLEMLRCMHRIRAFEQELAALYTKGRVPTEAIHLSIGQEGAAVGACFALRPDDYMATTHRGHGHMLAKGAPLEGMMAEVMARAPGLCGGKGGSMHVTDAGVGALGANGIVGASVLIATGAAHAVQRRGGSQVAVAFFGDGATNQGMFHEGLNMAALFRLPVVFVLEDNRYGEFTAVEKHTRAPSLAARASSYGMPAVTCDGNDVWAVYETVSEAVARARRAEGPTLVVAETYRWNGHMEGDACAYRPEGELDAWKARCPIRKLGEALGEDTNAALEAEARREVERAVEWALASPAPDPSSIGEHVFAPDHRDLWIPRITAADERAVGEREMSCSEALREALLEEMERDDRVYLLGEDVSRGGYFAVTTGLVEALGRERIVDTPISEYAIVGSAVGAAMAGARPVAEILFSDFLTCAMDPIVNNAAKLRYMSGGQVQLPLVVRAPGGAGLGMAAQHSQSLEPLLTGIPGLVVVAPGSAADAKGLLKAAIRSNNPVLFFENKLLYAATGPVPAGEHLTPLGTACVVRQGRDVTLVAIGAARIKAEAAAEELAREGIEVEVVDPRTLVPLDFATIARSVIKTGRLLTLEDAPLTHGFGSEVVARASETLFDALRCAPRRIAGADVPIPYASELEARCVPDVERVMEMVRAVVAG